MPIAYCSGKSIFFAHVPKTGGASVQDYLRRRFGELSIFPTDGNTSRVPKGGFIVPVQHLTAVDLERILPLNLDHSFAVVRDPIARLQSEYRFQASLSRTSNLSFSTWLRVVLSACSNEPRIYDNHIRPQIDLIPPGSKIFRLEDGLDRVTEWLDTIVENSNPNIRMGHLHQRPKTPLTVYSEDVELIAKFYKKDYLAFGYSLNEKFPQDKFAGARDILGKLAGPALFSWQRRQWLNG